MADLLRWRLQQDISPASALELSLQLELVTQQVQWLVEDAASAAGLGHRGASSTSQQEQRQQHNTGKLKQEKRQQQDTKQQRDQLPKVQNKKKLKQGKKGPQQQQQAQQQQQQQGVGLVDMQQRVEEPAAGAQGYSALWDSCLPPAARQQVRHLAC
jgi:hypothetical protein